MWEINCVYWHPLLTHWHERKSMWISKVNFVCITAKLALTHWTRSVKDFQGKVVVLCQPGCCFRALTREEVLGSQVADTEPQDGEFVQTGGDILRKREQAGQALQLGVQPVPVALGGVWLHSLSWGWFCPVAQKVWTVSRVYDNNIRSQKAWTKLRYVEVLIFPVKCPYT